MLDVEIRGVANLAKTAQDLVQARARVRELLSKASQDFANDATTDVKEKFLSGGQDHLKVRTGRLRSSIRYLLAEQASELTVTFGSDVPYAAIHEFGGRTPAHDIRPRKRRFLRFVSPNYSGTVRRTKSGKLARRQADGAVVFAQVVHHPGSVIPKRAFLEPGVSGQVPRFERAIADVLERAVTGAWSGQ